VNTREECHWSHTHTRASSEHAWDPMASSSAKFCLKTQTPYSSRNPMLLTLTQQNPWLKTRTVPYEKTCPRMLGRRTRRRQQGCQSSAHCTHPGSAGTMSHHTPPRRALTLRTASGTSKQCSRDDSWPWWCAAKLNHLRAFSVSERFMMTTVVSSGRSREEWHWSHAWQSFKRTCVGSNGILECRFVPENAHRTAAATQCC
jgi:hypothetical protein